jgi:hypothetical protein
MGNDMKLLEQKMDYIHHNPVKGKWNLAGNFTMYQHSSASYYECGQHKEFEVVDYRTL